MNERNHRRKFREQRKRTVSWDILLPWQIVSVTEYDSVIEAQSNATALTIVKPDKEKPIQKKVMTTSTDWSSPFFSFRFNCGMDDNFRLNITVRNAEFSALM